MADRSSYIISAKRSPVGRFLGGLSKLSAAKVGGQVAKAVVADCGVDPNAIEECLVGQVLQAGAGKNPARQVALGAGLPDTISACTVNKVCGSGLQSVMFADQIIRAGDADMILAGGIESMSQAPFLIRRMRNGHKFGDTQLIDALSYDGLLNVYDGDMMGYRSLARFILSDQASDVANVELGRVLNTQKMRDMCLNKFHSNSQICSSYRSTPRPKGS